MSFHRIETAFAKLDRLATDARAALLPLP